MSFISINGKRVIAAYIGSGTSRKRLKLIDSKGVIFLGSDAPTVINNNGVLSVACNPKTRPSIVINNGVLTITP